MNNRLERGLRILILLQSGRVYDAATLAAELNVTRRTIFRDIAQLKTLGVCIEYSQEKANYVVGVSDDAVDTPTDRQLSVSELSQAVTQSLSGAGSSVSEATIIRQVALSLASKTRLAGIKEPGTSYEGSYSEDNSVNASNDVASRGPLRGADAVTYWATMIKSKGSISVKHSASDKSSLITPIELRYTADGWTLSYCINGNRESKPLEEVERLRISDSDG